MVALARRKDRLVELAKTVSEATGKIYPYQADVTKEDDIINAFKWTIENVGPIHYLINNAGVSRYYPKFVEGKTQQFEDILNTNVLGLAIAARQAIRIMQEHNIDGHIINVSSILGHRVVNIPGSDVYTASKHAVTALTESLRLELVRNKSKIKISVKK